ncbi:hypothetical protein A2974_03735 [Candidatus Peregrinibacteria bacterium RIFCSPLOWO2_01_FULL_48_20]|nr:MAG: hypothetical protein A2974_03735 [Candidatus Peregrinibacteria bacterium RIFCSPLOWO2_01_FULL_48_20]
MSKLNTLTAGLIATLPLLGCPKKNRLPVGDELGVKLVRESLQMQSILDEYQWSPTDHRMSGTKMGLSSEESIQIQNEDELCSMNFKRQWDESLQMSGEIQRNMSDGSISNCWVHLHAKDLQGYETTWSVFYRDDEASRFYEIHENRTAVKGPAYRSYMEVFYCTGGRSDQDKCNFSHRVKRDWNQADTYRPRENLLLKAILNICNSAQAAAELTGCK